MTAIQMPFIPCTLFRQGVQRNRVFPYTASGRAVGRIAVFSGSKRHDPGKSPTTTSAATGAAVVTGGSLGRLIQQAMNEQTLKLLGNSQDVVGRVDETGEEAHSPKHRKQHIHHCRRVDVVGNLAPPNRLVDHPPVEVATRLRRPGRCPRAGPDSDASPAATR